MTKPGHYPHRAWSPRRACAIIGLSTLIAMGVLGGGRSSVEGTAAPLNKTASSVPHIMLIVEENRSYVDIFGSPYAVYAPYLNHLATTYVSATNWYAVQHKSENDYVDLFSGSNQGIPVAKPYAAPTLVDELHAKGVPWKAYVENLPSNCLKGSVANGLYDVFHNPFHYFTRYGTATGDWCNSANLSTEGVVTYPGSSGLVSALDATNAPDFVYVEPNDCDEMHGDKNTGSTCASDTQRQLIAAGDTWLSTNIGPVLQSSWFKQDGIVIITWDEGASTDTTGCCGGVANGGHVATIVITSTNQGRGQFTGTGDHYGTLAAIEKAYGVTLLLNSANTINGDLTPAFG
jgi:phosphatidylinositol-3-phosphatase